MEHATEELTVIALRKGVGHDGWIELAGHHLCLWLEGILRQQGGHIPHVHLRRVGPAGREPGDEGLGQRGEVGIVHPVHYAVRSTLGLSLEAEVKHVRQMEPILQDGHIGIGSLREVSTAHQHILTDFLSVCHDESTHVASVLYARKVYGTLCVSGWGRDYHHGHQYKFCRQFHLHYQLSIINFPEASGQTFPSALQRVLPYHHATC